MKVRETYTVSISGCKTERKRYLKIQKRVSNREIEERRVKERM